MRSSAAARRYARALFSLGQETGSVDALRGELDAMASLLADNPALSRILPLRATSTAEPTRHRVNLSGALP